MWSGVMTPIPVIGRRPLPRVTGIFNSAVVPFEGKFIGVFRTEGMDRVPHLHVGRSPDGLKFTFEPKPIELQMRRSRGAEARIRLRPPRDADRRRYIT